MGARKISRVAAAGLALLTIAACGDHDREKAENKAGQKRVVVAPPPITAANPAGTAGPGLRTADISKTKPIFYSEVAPADMLVSNLMGLDVYNLEGEKVGKIDDLVLGDGKDLHGIVVSAGDRRVAVRPGSLLVTRDENGNLRAVANTHRNDIRKAPVFRFANEPQAEAMTAAPAPEAASSAQSGEINVFFDFDRADLTPDARALLDRVAESAGKQRVVVKGHTDTSGPSDYNQRLSARRAQAVKKYLVRKGIPAKRIRTEALGENGLLVETGDGVREPQNRRAAIEVPGSQPQATPAGETETPSAEQQESRRRIGPNAGS